jgi:hypothetical protein
LTTPTTRLPTGLTVRPPALVLIDIETALMFHYFVNADARNKRIVLRDLFRVSKALGTDDRIARDRFHRSLAR